MLGRDQIAAPAATPASWTIARSLQILEVLEAADEALVDPLVLAQRPAHHRLGDERAAEEQGEA